MDDDDDDDGDDDDDDDVDDDELKFNDTLTQSHSTKNRSRRRLVKIRSIALGKLDMQV